jgi:type II secretory pathway predicted ATPase ExeA
VLLGHPKLKNGLRRPQMEEIGDRTTVFAFGGLRHRQRDYIDWVLKISLEEGVVPEDIMSASLATFSANNLRNAIERLGALGRDLDLVQERARLRFRSRQRAG